MRLLATPQVESADYLSVSATAKSRAAFNRRFCGAVGALIGDPRISVSVLAIRAGSVIVDGAPPVFT